MKDRRRKNHFEQITPMFWLVVAIWAAFLLAYRAIPALLAPVTTAVQSIEIKQ